MNKLYVALLISLFTSFLFPVRAQNYTELAIQGMEAMEKEEYEEAEVLFQQALKLEPTNIKNALLFSNMGTIYRLQKKYDEAIEAYNYALNIMPHSLPILLNRATIYMELGETRRAYIDYCQILDLDSENIEALLMRAYLSMTNRDYVAARVDYKKILSIDEKHYNALLGLATLAQNEKKHKEATEILTRMITEWPEDALLFLARAHVVVELEQWDMALLDVETAERLNPKSAELFALKGEIYLKTDKKHLAKTSFERAIQLGYPQKELSDLLKQCK